MTVYVALLRGINVGGNKIIKMADLKRMFDDMGLADAQTYIQSGNVLFRSEEEEEPLRERIGAEIKRVFGFDVKVVLRTAAELEQVVANCPYPADESAEGETVYVALLERKPAQAGIDKLLACNSDTDEFILAPREVYILLRQSVRDSPFSNNFLEKKLGVAATTRNWPTTRKLVELAKAMADGK